MGPVYVFCMAVDEFTNLLVKTHYFSSVNDVDNVNKDLLDFMDVTSNVYYLGLTMVSHC